MLTLPLKQSNSNETVAGKMIINISTNFSQPTTTTGLSAPSSSTPRVSADTPTHSRSDSIRKNTNTANPTIGASSSSSSPLSSFEDNLGPLPAGYNFFIFNKLQILFSWERRVDHIGRTYYVDHNTRATTWHRPSSTGPSPQDRIDLDIGRLNINSRTLPGASASPSPSSSNLPAASSATSPAASPSNSNTTLTGPMPSGWGN